MAGKEKVMDIPEGMSSLGYLFAHRTVPVPYSKAEKGGIRMFHRGDGNLFLGILAVSLGCGILIAAIFPTGALMFLVAFLLITCGCACCKR